MYCKKCGCEVEEDELYCASCSKIIKRAMWSISIMLVCLIAGLGAVIYSKMEFAQTSDEDALEIEISQEKAMIPDAATEGSVVEQVDNPYAVSQDNKTDYGCEQILNYMLYEHYEYDDNFNFSYPSAIYNQFSESDQERDGCFGRVIHEVGLGCDDDSYVNFSLTVRIDGRSPEEMTDIVYEYESGFIYENEVIAKSVDDNCGLVILKGYTSDELDAGIYNLIRIAPEYIYQMRIYYPAPRNKEEENHINYYLDCMYRMCGFSGNGAQPRSYVEYLSGQEK